jgi:hypothetical protein
MYAKIALKQFQVCDNKINNNNNNNNNNDKSDRSFIGILFFPTGIRPGGLPWFYIFSPPLYWKSD